MDDIVITSDDDELLELVANGEADESLWRSRKRPKLSHDFSRLSIPSSPRSVQTSSPNSYRASSLFSTGPSSTDYESEVSAQVPVEEEKQDDIDDLDFEGSQDPLLLSEEKILSPVTGVSESNSSPSISTTKIVCSPLSQDPLCMFDSTQSPPSALHTGGNVDPSARTSLEPAKQFAASHVHHQEVLIPENDTLSQLQDIGVYSSPFSSPQSGANLPSPSQQSPSPITHRSPPRQSPPPAITADAEDVDGLHIAQALQDAEASRSRYSLRKRGLQQEKPYLYDQLQYRHLMQHNPDAIVPNPTRGDRRRKDDQYEEESQDKEYSGSESRKTPSNVCAPNLSDDLPYDKTFNGLLPDISDDDLEGTTELRKEARALKKKERKERREREERERQQKAKKSKAFPLGREHASSSNEGSPPCQRARSVTPASEERVLQTESSPTPSHQNSPPIPTRRMRLVRGSSTNRHGQRSTSPLSSARSDSPVAGPSKSASNQIPLPVVDHSFDHRSPDPSDNIQPIVVDSDDMDVVMDSPLDIDAESSMSQSGSRKPGMSRREKEIERAKQARRKERKYRGALASMVPAFMIPMLLGKEKSSAKKVQNRPEPPGKLDLLPGQTHTRKARNSTPRPIKGDDVSSGDEEYKHVRVSSPGWEEDSNDLVHFEPEISSRHPSRESPHPQIFAASQAIEVLDSSSDGDISDAVEEYLGEIEDDAKEAEGLIDFMLMRPPNPSRKKRSDTKSRPRYQKRGLTSRPTAKSLSYKVDIVVGEARRSGKGVQTILSFDKHKAGKPLGRREGFRPKPLPGYKAAREPRKASPTESEPEDDIGIQYVNLPHTDQPKTKKQKERERHERRKKNGVHMVNSNTTHVRHSLHQSARTLEGPLFEDSQRPDAQSSRSYVTANHRHEKPSSSRLITSTPSYLEEIVDGSADLMDVDDEDSETGLHLDVERLTSGISIDRTTYIGRSQLFDLLNPSDMAHAPTSISAEGFNFGATTTFSQFLDELSKMCDSLLVFCADLPDLDGTKAHSWERLTRVTCQLLSWHLSGLMDERRALLVHRVEEEITKIIARMREASIPSSSMDSTTLVVCRFCVELSVRIGSLLPAFDPKLGICRTSTPLLESIRLLVHYLLEYGLGRLEYPIYVLAVSNEIPGMAQLTAELWIFLIHVINYVNSKNDSAKACHPLWSIVRDVLKSRLKSQPVEAFSPSEVVWHVIFDLSRLSQFSVHGTSTADVRLPSSWDLVSLALDHTSLKPDPEVYNDHDIKNVFIRCFHLFSHFHWDLGDAFTVIKRLRDDVFASRNLGNLQHEGHGLPSFVQRHSWSSCSQYDPGDTAYGIFLKLAVNAVDAVMKGSGKGTSVPPKAKKLLSLVAPVSSVTFTDDDSKGHQLSMLYNRFATIAVCIKKNPEQQVSRMNQARSYINFKTADRDTRRVYIQCLMVLSQMMVLEKLELSETLAWLGETIDILLDELPTQGTNGNKEVSDSQRRAVNMALLCINLLITAIRHIIGAYAEIREYPDPALIGRLEKFFKHKFLSHHPPTSRRLKDLVQSFLQVRSEVVPPPHRPYPESDAPESQDDFGELDLDINDSAALDRALNPTWEKDVQVSKSLEQISWSLYRLFCSYFGQPLPSEQTKRIKIVRYVEKILEVWLGCISIAVQHTTRTWASFLNFRMCSWGKIEDPRWKIRTEVYIMYTILKLEPRAVQSLQHEFFETLFIALVPEIEAPFENESTAMKSEFVSLFLSVIELRSPLLRGLDLDAYRGTGGDFVLKLEAHRLILLRGIITNLASSLREEREGNTALQEDNERYLGWCIELLKRMHRLYQDFEDSPAGQQYRTSCREILRVILDEHPLLKSESRMVHWETWYRSLD